MKTKFIYFFILIPLLSLAQSANEAADRIIVNYKSLLIDDRDQNGSFLYDNAKLITSEKESIYIETPRDTLFSSQTFDNCSTSGFDYKYSYYKDINKQIIYQDRNYGFGKVIADDSYKIAWKITGRTRTILGFNCNEATGFFRGREYKAYYFPEIRISNGPFKFDGLPGLILGVESTDLTVSIMATDITFDNTIGSITNPFISLESSTWSNFIEFYKAKFERITSQKTEDLEYFLPNRYIEYFVNL